ncbi:cellulose binding domain-containing protein [Catellatospora sp. KI3]|uniref:cellulose binding domain-containing protein n=1 Tax=Catellatospora sp. KI3 TaxID=3041620 RepID=UPI002482A2A3|nr:cellulose binding domain-containing protein [Catellatospora sp. KI3]MDI1462903.1 cellulose binding domain-containing protein [Catellatospora sp. KI3]
MSKVIRYRRVLTAALLACGLAVGTGLLAAAPAQAAVLFADDFEQPTANIWLTGSGGTWSVVSEDGSKVWRQSGTTLSPTAWAGSGSGTGTTVTGRIKPTSTLSPANLVSLTGRVANPNNLYYAGLRGGTTFEIGQVSWGTTIVLASVPFPHTLGTWYGLSLSFPTAGTVTGSVTAPGGATATLSAADPGGIQQGDRVGFYMRTATASLDDIRLTDSLPEPSPPTGPCVAEINVTASVIWGNLSNVTLTFKNISAAPIAPSWSIRFKWADGQTITSVRNANWYQVGPRLTLTSSGWYPAVAPGATSNPPVGFTLTGPLVAPSEATFNGVPCPITLS